MSVFKSLLAGTTLLVCVLAQGNVAFTEWPSSLTPGIPATFKWTGGNGPATITLERGDPNDLKEIKVLTENGQNGEFTWIPTADLADGSDYAFRISQDGQVNYSGQIQVTGGDSNQRKDETSATESATTTATSSVHIPSNTPTTTPSPFTMTSSASTTPSSSSASQQPSSTQPSSTPQSSSAARTKASPTSHSAMSTHSRATRPTSTSTTSASKSVHTGAAGRYATPLGLVLGAAAAALFL
ncbi:hypothetical protein VTN77DRAFT_5134 [Rasamsonia byssochlamydoides]|uniref:uncharacterized protein n=1 Tax=Rasamsonia byssochlamydoides TaxID=89139 RepID=UPI003744759A